MLKDIVICLPYVLILRTGILFSAKIAPHAEKFSYVILAPGDNLFILAIPVGESSTRTHVPQLSVTVSVSADVASALATALHVECATAGTP